MDFSQKFQMYKYIFVKFIEFLAVSRIQECFHWLSSLIYSGVMADQRFAGHCSSQYRRKRVKFVKGNSLLTRTKWL